MIGPTGENGNNRTLSVFRVNRLRKLFTQQIRSYTSAKFNIKHMMRIWCRSGGSEYSVVSGFLRIYTLSALCPGFHLTTSRQSTKTDFENNDHQRGGYVRSGNYGSMVSPIRSEFCIDPCIVMFQTHRSLAVFFLRYHLSPETGSYH